MNTTTEQTVTPVKKGRIETKVIEIPKEMEQNFISQYQCFGWDLKNNQEVNITSVSGGSYAHGRTIVTSSTKTYIKLTFERHTNMENYDILNEKFKEYVTTYEEVLTLLQKIKNSNFSVLAGAVVGGGYALFNILTALGGFLALYRIFLSIMCGLLIFLLVGLIVGVAIKKPSTKKKLTPKINELCEKMNSLAEEASEYLV